MCLKNGEKGREKRRAKDEWKMEDKAGERKWKRKLVNDGRQRPQLGEKAGEWAEKSFGGLYVCVGLR